MIYSMLILCIESSENTFSKIAFVCSNCTHWLVQGMMTPQSGNIFRVSGLLCGKFTGRRWIPRTKASGAELWYICLICTWTNSWANNGDAGDLRRHRAHYDVSDLLWRHPAVTLTSLKCYMASSKVAHFANDSVGVIEYSAKLYGEGYFVCPEHGRTYITVAS